MNGVVNYVVLGWFVTSANIGFLVPMTIINGATFITFLVAAFLANAGGHILHPFHPRTVIYDDHTDHEELVPDEWRYKVTIHPVSVRIFRFYNVFFHCVDSSIGCYSVSEMSSIAKCRVTSQLVSKALLCKLLKNKL